MLSDRTFSRHRVARTRKLSLEPLETRTLLSANPFFTAASGGWGHPSRAVLIGPPTPAADVAPVGRPTSTQTATVNSPGSFGSATPVTLNSSGGASVSSTISSAGTVTTYSVVANLNGTMTV